MQQLVTHVLFTVVVRYRRRWVANYDAHDQGMHQRIASLGFLLGVSYVPFFNYGFVCGASVTHWERNS